MEEKNLKVDVVITWVDGADARLSALRQKYGNKEILSRDDMGGASRYLSVKEIFWCIASINRFAPWINRIYIVTDNQRPEGLEDFLAANFPEGYIPFQIVDHKEIFKGYEEYLPTFNSLSIETMLWRIPGLSDHFIEFNDDVMLGRPTAPSDFFVSSTDTPICYAYSLNTYWTLFKRILKFRLNGNRKLNFKQNMVSAALLEGFNPTFLRMEHTPKPLSRQAMEESLGEHPERMVRNVRHRFRHKEQFNAEELHYLHLRRSGHLSVIDPRPSLFILQPKHHKDHVKKEMTKLREGNYKFCCFNNFNLATPTDLALVKDWVRQTLQLSYLP